MQHLFIHSMDVFRDVQLTDDEGNPVTDDGTPVTENRRVWSGPCKKDDYQAYSRAAGVDTKTVRTAIVFCSATADVQEDDHAVIDEYGTKKRWRIDNIEQGTSMGGLHHLEIQMTNVVNA